MEREAGALAGGSLQSKKLEMPLTKEELRRAAAIMGSILTDLEHRMDLHFPSDEEMEGLMAMQTMLDIVQSPLFSSLVDIRDQCKKSVQDSEKWNEAAEVRVTDTSDTVAQFKQRYNIAGAQTSTDADHLIDDLTLPRGNVPDERKSPAHDVSDTSQLRLLSRNSHEGYGSTLNEEQYRTPSVSSTDSHGSAGGKRKKGRRQAAGEGMTLGHLAHTLSQGEGIPLKMLPARELSKMKPRNSESSLSSLSSETSPPPLPSTLPPDVFFPTSTLTGPTESAKEKKKYQAEDSRETQISGATVGNEAALTANDTSTATATQADTRTGDKKGPRDVLFFMRDKKSMTDLRAALNGKWGRDRREVVLPRVSNPDSIGLELCGLSDTGVYVAATNQEVVRDKLQIGDQILQVDGHKIENMAWFEVSYLMQGVQGALIGEGAKLSEQEQAGMSDERDEEAEKEKRVEQVAAESCVMVVQYNPAGLAECQRRNKKIEQTVE